MKKQLLILGSLAVFSSAAFGQIGKKKGDEQFQLYNYAKAVTLYEEAFKEKKSYYLAHQIATCYKMVNNYKLAESWFAETIKFPEHQVEDELAYATILRNNAKFIESKNVYTGYALKANVPVQEQTTWKRSCDSAIAWMKNPEPYSIVNRAAINTSGSDWGAVVYNKTLVFTSDDRKEQLVSPTKNKKPFLRLDGVGSATANQTIYGWTGRGFLNIYQTAEADSSIRPLFYDEDNRTYHVSSPCFSGDGNEVYYTETRVVKNDKSSIFKQEPYKINLEIYSRTKDKDGNWSAPIPFKHNNSLKYSVGDPYITPNGKYLYFSSDLPGGLGGTDLYYCKMELDGTWGEPVNLGAGINTSGNERFPRFSADDIFYFSSDGRVGLGGLDIYQANVTDQGFLAPQNLGYPINTPQDDFAVYFTGKDKGFLSSNREGGKGDDDIYSFAIVMQPVIIKGDVTDDKTGLPLEDAVVTAVNTKTGELIKTTTNAEGKFSLQLDDISRYNVSVENTGYLAATALNAKTSQLKGIHWKLTKITSTPVKLENIYYDFNKASLRAESKAELDKLVTFMQENPSIEIELGSHTDSRGNDKYNLKLSQARAQSVVNYLIGKGISKNRLTAKGYGETQLVNKCANGVACTEAEHQENRRTEFKVTRY